MVTRLGINNFSGAGGATTSAKINEQKRSAIGNAGKYLLCVKKLW